MGFMSLFIHLFFRKLSVSSHGLPQWTELLSCQETAAAERGLEMWMEASETPSEGNLCWDFFFFADYTAISKVMLNIYFPFWELIWFPTSLFTFNQSEQVQCYPPAGETVSKPCWTLSSRSRKQKRKLGSGNMKSLYLFWKCGFKTSLQANSPTTIKY